MTDRPVPQSGAEGALPKLFTPITLRGVTARNRVMVSPMCQYHSANGSPTDWHMMHLGRLAVGGAGILFGEETAVEARGRKTHECAGLWNDAQIPHYARLTDFIRQQGAVPAIQIGHCGRKAGCHGAVKDWAPLTEADAAEGRPPWQGLAPSPIPYGPGFMAPKEMDADDIRDVIDAFGEAARRAVDAGYDIIDVHGAHGYLLHQFLSPITNRRSDGYGGDREGRMRLLLEVTERVRTIWPQDRPVFVRFSVVDGKGGVWCLEDSLALARALKERDVDVLDISSGGIGGETDMPALPRTPGYHVPFAERLRAATGLPVVAVGMITDPSHAEDILQSERADIIALAREFIWNADWAAHAAKTLGVPGANRLMPEEYAHRLDLRDSQQAMSFNRPGPESAAAFAALLGDAGDDMGADAAR